MSGESHADAVGIPVEGLERSEFKRKVLPPFRVRLKPGVHESVWGHGKESLAVELCGVLLGRVLRDDDGPHLLVEDWVRGEYARSEGAQVTFTHATWEHIHGEMKRRYPKGGSDIVGWYHTHPGFGIFLSEMDLFIHTNFFSGPGQVAFVLDPKSGEEGLFGWVKGKVERFPAFWVGERRIGEVPVTAPPIWTAAASAGQADPGMLAPGSDEIDVARSLGRIRFSTLMALLWGLLLGWVASGFAGSWQLSGAVRDAARAEVAGLVRTGILAGAQRAEMEGLADRIENVASSLPEDPPAAEGTRGPRAVLTAVAGDARQLAKQAGERARVVEAALSSPRTYYTTGELGRQIESQGRQVRRITDFTELLVASGEWEAMRRALAGGTISEEEARRRGEAVVRRVESVIQSDPGLAEVVPSMFPGLVLRKDAPAGKGGAEGEGIPEKAGSGEGGEPAGKGGGK